MSIIKAMFRLDVRGQKKLAAKIRRLADSGGGKWGWLPELRKIGKHLKDATRKRLTAHTAPGGGPWPSYFYKDLPQLGEDAPMLIGDIPAAKPPSIRTIVWPRSKQRASRGTQVVVTQASKTTRGMLAAWRFRERWGPPWGPTQALIRKKPSPGAYRKTKILDFLVGAKAMGRAMRFEKDKETGARSLVYGYTKSTDWIRQLHFGGQSKKFKARIPPRPVLGATAADEKFMAATFKAGWQKRIAKLTGGG